MEQIISHCQAHIKFAGTWEEYVSFGYSIHPGFKYLLSSDYFGILATEILGENIIHYALRYDEKV
jgi:hypothetical protein